MMLKSGKIRQMDSLHQKGSWAQVQKNMQIVERKCKSVQYVILQSVHLMPLSIFNHFFSTVISTLFFQVFIECHLCIRYYAKK